LSMFVWLSMFVRLSMFVWRTVFVRLGILTRRTMLMRRAIGVLEMSRPWMLMEGSVWILNRKPCQHVEVGLSNIVGFF